MVRATPERDAQLDQSLLALVSGAPVNSHDMQRVVGHLTCRFLLRRPLLSTLHEVYKFVNRDIRARVSLWPSVIDEIRMIRGLLVFAFSDIKSPVSCRIMMSDACLSGYGIGESRWEPKGTMEVLSWDERWRFKDRIPGETHRQRAMQEYQEQTSAIACADICTDVLSVRSSTALSRELQEDFSFPNIRARLLQPTQ